MKKTMTREEAAKYLYRLEDIYCKEYNDYCELTGEAPCGPPGQLILHTFDAVAAEIERYTRKILELREKVAVLKENKDTGPAERVLNAVLLVVEEGVITFPHALEIINKAKRKLDDLLRERSSILDCPYEQEPVRDVGDIQSASKYIQELTDIIESVEAEVESLRASPPQRAPELEQAIKSIRLCMDRLGLY